MSEIHIDETTGTSEKSLTDALANAIQSVLKDYDGSDTGLKITVIIEGISMKNGKFKVNVKVLILDPLLEQEEKFHETLKQLNSRMEANQDLAEQMNSAIYAMPIATNTNGVKAVENIVDNKADISDNFEFNQTNDDITVIANTDIHQHLNAESRAAKQEPTLNPPSLDLGGGSSSSGDKDIA